MKKLLVLILACAPAFAQFGSSGLTVGTAVTVSNHPDTTKSCTNTQQIQYDYVDGTMWACQITDQPHNPFGNWIQVNSAAGGGLQPPGSAAIVKTTGAGTTTTAAVAGTDYMAPTTAVGGDLSGVTLSPQVTKINGVLFPTSAPLLKSNGSAQPIAAVPGTDFVALNTTLLGDVSGTPASTTVSKINGTTVPASSAADQFLGTMATGTGTWIPFSNCLDTGGQHLNYNTTTHAISCGTSGGSGGGLPASATFLGTTSGGVAQTTTVSGSISVLSTGVSTLTDFASVADYAGADFAAKANACLAAIPSGGTCFNSSRLTGAQTASTTIAIPAHKTLQLGGITLTSTADPIFTVADGSRLLGVSGSGGAGTATTNVISNTSGATGIQADCTATSCASTRGTIKVDGMELKTNFPNTGIGIDIYAIGQSMFTDLWLVNWASGITTSISCQSPSCNYNEFHQMHLALPAGGNGIWFRFSDNAEKVVSADFKNGLNQFLVGSLDSSNVTDEINCFGCTFESAAQLSTPTIPTLGGAGGTGTACVQIEYVTLAGATLPSTESCISTLNGSNLTITSPSAVAGALGWLPFIGVTSGTERANTVQGTCGAFTLNAQSVCTIGTGWTQTAGSYLTTTRTPDPVNSSGAAVSVVRGQNIIFFGGRCEPGLANALCLQTYPDVLAGPLATYGMFFQFSSPSDTARQDQSGQMLIHDSGNTLQSWHNGIDTSSAPNLVDNASLEGWSAVTQPYGWSNLVGTNWASGTTEMQQSTSNVGSGTYSVQLGDTNTIVKGMAMTNRIPIDNTRPYTLSWTWTTAHVAVGMSVAFQAFDSSGTLLTDTGTFYRQFATTNSGNGGTVSQANLFYSGGCQCWNTSPLTQTSANVQKQQFITLKFLPNVASVKLGLEVMGTAQPGLTTIWVDDIYLAQGTAVTPPKGSTGAQTLNYLRPVYDSGNAGVSQMNGYLSLPGVRSGVFTNTDLAGTLTLVAGTATYTFLGSYTNPPICVANDTTAANAVKVSATSTVLTLTGTTTDVLNYACMGRN